MLFSTTTTKNFIFFIVNAFLKVCCFLPDLIRVLKDLQTFFSLCYRELPNPLCTYQLYRSFVEAVQGCNSSPKPTENERHRERLLKMREAVQKLPPPHYRTLEYLTRHLARVAAHGSDTGMTTRNIAIVWAPNLLRCAELEVGGVAALQGVGVQVGNKNKFVFLDQSPSHYLVNV